MTNDIDKPQDGAGWVNRQHLIEKLHAYFETALVVNAGIGPPTKSHVY